jgi:hypothetical protein
MAFKMRGFPKQSTKSHLNKVSHLRKDPNVKSSDLLYEDDDEGGINTERTVYSDDEIKSGSAASTHFIDDGKKRFLSNKLEIPLDSIRKSNWKKENWESLQKIKEQYGEDSEEYQNAIGFHGHKIGALDDPSGQDDFVAPGESSQVGFEFDNQTDDVYSQSIPTVDASKNRPLDPNAYGNVVLEQKPSDWSNKQWKEYLADRKAVFNPKTGTIEEYIKRGSGIGYKKTGNVIEDQAYIDEYNKQQQQQQQQEQEEANKKQWEKENKKQLKLNEKLENQEKKKNPKLKWDGTNWVKNPNYNPNWKVEQGWKELEFPS